MLSLDDSPGAKRNGSDPSHDSAPNGSRSARGRSPFVFFREFLQRPKEVAYLFPSSPALERRIARVCDLSEAKVVIELGPGTGGTTRALLRQMAPDAKLMAIEINPRLADQVRENIEDPRLTVHTGDASKIGEALAEHGFDAPDVVVSGIPFSCMPVEIGEAIQKSIHQNLSPEGRFVAYQLRSAVAKIGSGIFGKPKVSWELANLPPMRIFRFDMPSQNNNGHGVNGANGSNGVNGNAA